MVDSDSDTSSVNSKEIVSKSKQTKGDPDEIRARKLENLKKAREAATKSLALKSELKKNEKEIAERERLLKLTEQRKKKEKLTKKMKKIQKDESESESESDDEPEPPKKSKKKAPVKKTKKYKGRELEADSSSSDDDSSDDEEVLKKKIVSKRAKKTRDTVLKEDLEAQLDKDYWAELARQVSGRI